MNMLRLEYDIQHHLVLSKRNPVDHALIRMIVSTLSTPAELSNLRKRDFRLVRGKDFDYYTVALSDGTTRRISPVDEKTYNLMLSLPATPFELSRDEMDAVVSKYSPPDRSYNCEKLRKAVETFLKDAAFSIEIGSIKSLEEKYAYMLDFNPLYSGLWDLEEYEDVEDFILNYSEVSGVKDPNLIAAKIGVKEDVVRKVLGSGKRSILFYNKSFTVRK